MTVLSALFVITVCKDCRQLTVCCPTCGTVLHSELPADGEEQPPCVGHHQCDCGTHLQFSIVGFDRHHRRDIAQRRNNINRLEASLLASPSIAEALGDLQITPAADDDDHEPEVID